ncbi:MAG: S9 family peptidase [Gemmatimonadota bacterium]
MIRRPAAALVARAAVLLLLAGAPLPLAGQEKPSDTLLTVAKYLDYETVGEPRLSPDGTQIIYTRRWINKLEDRWESALWIMNADGSRNRFLTKGSGAVWSPDGTRIAFLAEGEPKGVQIFVRWMDAEGATTQVTRLTQAPANLEWMPDGKRIVFSSFVPRSSTWKIDLPTPPEGARWTPAPKHIETLHYRNDRVGFTKPGFTHLFIVDADGGTPRQLTSGDWSVGARFDGLAPSVGYDISPDGKTIVVDGYQGDWDRNFRDATIYRVDVATGATTALIKERGTWTNPVYSPDGKRIAYTGYAAVNQTYRVADLWVMNADGSAPTNLTGALDRAPQDLTWAADGNGIYFTADDHGARNLHFVSLTGAISPVTRGAQLVTLGAIRNGVAAAVVTGPKAPGDIWRIDLRSRPGATMTQLTRVNADLLDRVKLGDVEEFWATSSGGVRVQGWVVKPPSFDPAKKYPLIMEIHGGPHSMYNVGFNYMFQNFAANGYVVLYMNPRGSTGYGTAFGNAINKKYPGVDYDDLMAALDTIVGRGYVDTRRMYVGGCSGGGVLSSWVIGHTDRFAAAAVRCPVINWISMAGQSDIPYFTHQWFEKPFWEDPKPWLEQSSLMYVGNVRTPVLLMTGELDMRTPMPQSEEYFAALQVRGVPSALLRFEGEYHGTGSRPSNFMRTQLYMMSWYQRWPAGGQSVSETK